MLLTSVEVSLEKLEIFRTEIGEHGIHAFVVLDQKGRNDAESKTVEISLVWLARVDSWISAVKAILIEKKARGGHRQMLYADPYGRMLHLAMEQIVRNIGWLM